MRRERKSVRERSRVGQVVFGVQDGVTTTVGILAAMVGGHQSNAVTLFVGTATAFAGMVSMGVGSYLAAKAERDVELAELRRERQRIERHRDHEIRELAAIYESHGMTGRTARAAARRVARDPDRLLEIMASEEFGIAPGRHDAPRKDALAAGTSFLFGAGLPVVPYGVFHDHAAFFTSIGIAGTALIAVGALNARVAGLTLWKSAAVTFAFGALATAIGYLAGTVLPKLFGVTPIG